MSVTMWLIWGAVALVLGMYWAWLLCGERWRRSFVAMGYPGTEVGLSVEDLRSEEAEVLYQSPPSVFANTGPLCVFRVHQRKESEKREERGK